MQRPSVERAIGIGLGGGAVALVAVLVLSVGSALITGGPAHTPSRSADDSPVAAASQTVSASGSPTGAAPSESTSPTPSETAVSAPTPTAPPTTPPTAPPTAVPTAAPTISPQLPAMLAAIGDSYTQAWSVSPAYLRDHPGYSWAVGTYKGDGVFSLRERFESLGDKVNVVDAATSGKKMSDAARQATRIVSEAVKLPPGSTAYLTFELGTNDLCDYPTTDPATFEAQLRASVGILRSGLPAGSRILMLSVPDFSHFYDITQADSKARTLLNQTANSRMCAPFLGSDSPLSLQAAEQVRSAYDAILFRVCDEIQAAGGSSGKLYCLHNDALLSERNFTIKDMSTFDYFHPSVAGQAAMAASAWAAGYWRAVALPSGAAAVAPGGAGPTGGEALAGIAAPLALFIGRRPRRRPGPRTSPR